MEDLGDIIQEFLVESHENLDQLDRDLVSLEQQPQSRDLVARVFRTIHTIKGTCGFLGLPRLEKPFEHLKEWLPMLHKARAPGMPIRIWSPR